MLEQPKSEMTFDTSPDSHKPIIALYASPTLIDTGADIPVVYLPEFVLKTAFKGTCLKERAVFRGFGGACYGKIYALKNFKVGELNFEHFEVFVPNDLSSKFRYVLPPSIFHGTQLVFDIDAHTFTVKMPENFPKNRDFRIVDLKGHLYAQIDGVLLQDEYDQLIEEEEYANYTQFDYIL